MLGCAGRRDRHTAECARLGRLRGPAARCTVISARPAGAVAELSWLGRLEVMTSAISHQGVSDLIGRIYDCTLDPARWEPTLDAIRTLLQTATAQLALFDPRQHRILIQKTLAMDSRLLEL